MKEDKMLKALAKAQNKSKRIEKYYSGLTPKCKSEVVSEKFMIMNFLEWQAAMYGDSPTDSKEAQLRVERYLKSVTLTPPIKDLEKGWKKLEGWKHDDISEIFKKDLEDKKK